MRKMYCILLLSAIVFSVSVSAKAPPGHGVVKESKNKLCPSFVYAPSIEVATPVHPFVVGSYCDVVFYNEPVRNWQYVDLAPSLYSSPTVEKPSAFYARSSC